MTQTDWLQVAANGYQVPRESSLIDLTAELTGMLGSNDPVVRDQVAVTTLTRWIEAGEYDDLLLGLGDGMLAGLIGAASDQTQIAGPAAGRSSDVFRRSRSALVLGHCLKRTNPVPLGGHTVLRWGDGLMGWFAREPDLRGFIPGHGWAHAIAYGADALGALAEASALGAPELTAILDLVTERLTTLRHVLTQGEPDRLALTVLTVLRRDAVPMSVVEPWLYTLADRANLSSAVQVDPLGDPYLLTANAEALLRALHMQLILTDHPPAARADLQLAVVSALRISNAIYPTSN